MRPRRLPIFAFGFFVALAGGVGTLHRLAYAADLPASAPDDLLSFPTRILPILTKAGCNAGACHGAATGQAGFKLSLRGYDPEADHHAITRELTGRRIDLASPAESLLLRKPTKAIHHKGGLRIERDSDDYATLIAWIQRGAPYGPTDLRVARIEVVPSDVLLSGEARSVRIKVTATLSDGTSEDVTPHALYSSNDDALADVDEDGALTVRRPGLTAVMVRYGGQVAAVRVASPLRAADVAETSFPEPRNFIDEKVFAELRRLRVPPSPVSADAVFLRRVYLDVIGQLPPPSAVRQFLADPAGDAKRDRVIEDLSRRDAFVDLWTMRLADLLLIDSARLGEAPARAYHIWLRAQVAANTPVDRLVAELITATGDAAQNGPANFNRIKQDPRDMAEYVSATFLGTQIAWPRCHAHPFAAWTQDDYYGFAAFFARTRDGGGRVLLSDAGEVQHPKTHRDVAARPLGGAPPQRTGTSGAERLADVSQWVTSPENPYFARAFVNRVWRHLMGRGLFEPVDDLRVTNPPMNPALLDALAADFVKSGYDLRHLVKVIAASQTYQLSSATLDDNRADGRLYSHAYPRSLGAQVLADAIAQATGVPDAFKGYPPQARAVQLLDARVPSDALDVLGRCTRDANCEAQPRGGGVPQALHLINGSTINAKLRGRLADLLFGEGRTDGQIVEDIYLRALGRLPDAQELAYCEQVIHDARKTRDDRDAVEDLMWALLNGREFQFNH